MGKIDQKKGEKGSLKWIQCVVNEAPHLLNKPINRHVGLSEGGSIEWLSPLKNDSYAEYRDQAFLDSYIQIAVRWRQIWQTDSSNPFYH